MVWTCRAGETLHGEVCAASGNWSADFRPQNREQVGFVRTRFPSRTLRGIYDPDKIELTSIVVPEPPKVSQPYSIPDIAKLKGDLTRGAAVATACQTCHRIGNDGVEYAPNLTGWAARNPPLDVLLRSIIEPSADISHGFNGHELTLKDGTVIHGLILADADPVIIMSTGAITQTVPKNRIKEKKPMTRSLMLSAEQMGRDAQGLADVAAFLRTK